MILPRHFVSLAALFSLLFAGCGDHAHKHEHPTLSKPTPSEAGATTPDAKAEADKEEAEIKAIRAKLSPEDQKLVAAQEWCPIPGHERLGTPMMGAPVKIMIKGQPVFLCCGGCEKDALADPDKTLAMVEKLKAKAKAAAEKK